MRRTALLPLLLVLAVPASSVAAQPPARRAVGARVRLATPTLLQHPQLIGRISDLDAEAVTIHTDLGEDTRVPRSFITEVAVSHGATSRRASVVRAAAVGLVIGAVAGRLSIPERGEDGRPTGLQYAVRGGAIGTLLGAAFGGVNRSERWDAVLLRDGTLDPVVSSSSTVTDVRGR